MAYLIATSILVRLANTGDRAHTVAVRAVAELHRRGEILNVAPQNLIEFRSVATRPPTANGLGLSAKAAAAKSAVFETAFALLLETPDIYSDWKRLVEALGVVGKQVHDAGLVAVCHVQGVTHLLTFDVVHFGRLAGLGAGVVVVDPVGV